MGPQFPPLHLKLAYLTLSILYEYSDQLGLLNSADNNNELLLYEGTV